MLVLCEDKRALSDRTGVEKMSRELKLTRSIITCTNEVVKGLNLFHQLLGMDPDDPKNESYPHSLFSSPNMPCLGVKYSSLQADLSKILTR